MEIILKILGGFDRDDREDEGNPNALRSGCFTGTTSEQRELFTGALVDAEAKHGMHPMFVNGVLATYAFFTCKEGEEMHGATAREFFENAYLLAVSHMLEDISNIEIAGGEE